MDENNNPIQENGVKTEETMANNGAKKVNNMALLSFIFSLAGLLVAAIPCGIVALITGIMGLVKFNKDTEKFKWMAIVGIILGVIDIIAGIANIVIRASFLV